MWAFLLMCLLVYFPFSFPHNAHLLAMLMNSLPPDQVTHIKIVKFSLAFALPKNEEALRKELRKYEKYFEGN